MQWHCSGMVAEEYGPSEELECQVRAQRVRGEFCEMNLRGRQEQDNIGLGRLIESRPTAVDVNGRGGIDKKKKKEFMDIAVCCLLGGVELEKSIWWVNGDEKNS